MVDLTDIAGYQDKLNNELDKIDATYDGRDRRLVKRFVQRLDGDVTPATLEKYLRYLRKTAERLDMPLTELTGPVLEEHIYDISHDDSYGQHGTGLSDSTIRQIEFILRKFFREMDLDTDGWHDDYELRKAGDNRVSADDMLVAEDIAALREAATNMRDIAFIEFLADTGARRTLAGSLRVGDVDVESEAATYTPNDEALGLKGAEVMPYPLIDSRATIRQYLATTHPRPDEDDVALFHKLEGHGNTPFDGDGAITAESLGRILRNVAARADVDKPTNPHNFRHSAVTRMAREGYTRSQIEHRVHWKIDTKMWETYQHIAGEEHNTDIFEAAGILDPDEESRTAERHPCGNCGEALAPHHEFCPRCASPATPRARELFDRALTSIGDGQAAAEDTNRRELRAAVTRGLLDDASVLGDHDSPSQPNTD